MNYILDMFGFLRYIFSSQLGYKKPYKFPSPKMIVCRIKKHPNGVVWQNVYGLEPNMRCKNCDEDLG
jgi:hypothetical protein